jgi:hypothetical protein
MGIIKTKETAITPPEGFGKVFYVAMYCNKFIGLP